MTLIDPNRPAQPQNQTPRPGSPSQPAPQVPGTVQVRYKSAVKTPWVTYILLGVTILIYILQVASEYLYGVDFPAYFGMKYNDFILQGEIWRLFTPMFLHGSITHIAFNMYALYSFGAGLERHYGHGRFAALYFLAGIAGNVASFILSSKASLGASTAIFGIVAAEGVFIYRNRFLFGKRYTSAITNIVMIVVINLVLGLSPRIDNWGHLGGLLGGLAFSWFAGPVLKVEGLIPDLALIDTQGVSSRTRMVALLELLVLACLCILPFLR